MGVWFGCAVSRKPSSCFAEIPCFCAFCRAFIAINMSLSSVAVAGPIYTRIKNQSQAFLYLNFRPSHAHNDDISRKHCVMCVRPPSMMRTKASRTFCLHYSMSADLMAYCYNHHNNVKRYFILTYLSWSKSYIFAGAKNMSAQTFSNKLTHTHPLICRKPCLVASRILPIRIWWKSFSIFFYSFIYLLPKVLLSQPHQIHIDTNACRSIFSINKLFANYSVIYGTFALNSIFTLLHYHCYWKSCIWTACKHDLMLINQFSEFNELAVQRIQCEKWFGK